MDPPILYSKGKSLHFVQEVEKKTNHVNKLKNMQTKM